MQHLILYAEDDYDFGKDNVNDFRSDGFNVLWAKDGIQAIEYFKEYSPDIVLLDIEMPGLNGYQVAEEIKRKNVDTPIIFLTSFNDSKNAVKGLNIGALDYIRKDIASEELIARIRNAIQRNQVKHDPVIKITDDTFIDTVKKQLTSFGKTYDMSFRDFNLLRTLLINKNIPQKRDLLIKQIWDNNENSKTYISKSISILRRLMSQDKRLKIITNRSDSVVLTIDESYGIYFT
ncbi:MAG: response regulator transcription factor [Bacteroidales bacterium]|jgi:DNA-binding response OmpR family regulator|nr:response regulator transcription factor [Bacteroidales bacterium]